MFERFGRAASLVRGAAIGCLAALSSAAAVAQDAAQYPTPLDIAIRDAQRTVEARRAVEDAFLDSTVHLAIRSGADGGGQFLVGRRNGRAVFQVFDTAERLTAWVARNAADIDDTAAFSGPADEFLEFIDARTRGGVFLDINTLYAYPLMIDPDLFGYLVVRAGLPDEADPDLDGDPPRTPMEMQVSLLGDAEAVTRAWQRDFLRLLLGQIVYVAMEEGGEQDDAVARGHGGTGYVFALDTLPGESGGEARRLAVFDRRDAAQAYAEDYEARHGTAIGFHVMRGRELVLAMPEGVVLDVNPGSAFSRVVETGLLDRIRTPRTARAGANDGAE